MVGGEEGAAPPSGALREASRYYKSAIFRSTHNSYSGDFRGRRGSILSQLRAGVRFLEFDVHAPDGDDYRLGHAFPGHEVWRSDENPRSTDLSAWLHVVASWVRSHPTAAPVTIAIDMKSNLAARHSASEGGFAKLNRTLEDAFRGGLLVTPDEFARLGERNGSQGPTVDDLRGRVVVVLSGNEASRCLYGWDVGKNPAIAMNDSGWIVEVHNSPTWPAWRHGLWYWTGRRQSDGRIRWHHHGRYDAGTTPSVAINNAGLVVEVHKSGQNSGLWCRVGQLNETTRDIEWRGVSTRYDYGVTPTVRFENLDGVHLHGIHASQSHVEQKWARRGVLSSTAAGIEWQDNGKTDSGLYNKSTAEALGFSLSVESAAEYSLDGLAKVPNTLLCTMRISSNNTTVGRIAFPSLAFVEFQEGNLLELLNDGAVFHATKAVHRDWTAQQRRCGHIVRQWGFNERPDGTLPAPNFPATDFPYEDWYSEYTSSWGTME